jgi:hypothetical protein
MAKHTRSKRHGKKHGKKHGGAYLGGPAYEIAAAGSFPQQMNQIDRNAYGPANPNSSLLQYSKVNCMNGGKRRTHKKRSHKKRGHKKSRHNRKSRRH